MRTYGRQSHPSRMSRSGSFVGSIALASLIGLLLGVLPSSAAAAASISGTVTAEDSEAPLQFVSVCIYEADGFGSFVGCGSTEPTAITP